MALKMDKEIFEFNKNQCENGRIKWIEMFYENKVHNHFLIHPKYLDRQAWANCVDPDQMPWNVTSQQGLQSLPVIQQFLDKSTGCQSDLFNPCLAE